MTIAEFHGKIAGVARQLGVSGRPVRLRRIWHDALHWLSTQIPGLGLRKSQASEVRTVSAAHCLRVVPLRPSRHSLQVLLPWMPTNCEP